MSEEAKEILFLNQNTNNDVNDVIYEFTKTYNIRNIEESNDETYLYLTLRQFQMEEVATVKIPRNLSNNIEVGSNYEFTFQYNYPTVELKESTIEEIFEKCNLVAINYTDKVGLEQTQESEIPQN